MNLHVTPLEAFIGLTVLCTLVAFFSGRWDGRRTAIGYTEEDMDDEWDKAYKEGARATEEALRREQEASPEFGYIPPPNLHAPRIWGPVEETFPQYYGSVTVLDETSPWLRSQLTDLAEWSARQRKAIAS